MADVPVYYIDHQDNQVVRVTSCTQQVTRLSVCSLPLQLELTPNGSQLIVTCFNNAIDIINTATFTVTSMFQTDQNFNPDGIAITPDGTQAYIANFNNVESEIGVLNLSTGQMTQTIAMPSYPQSVFMSPDGQMALVTFPFLNAAYVVDTLSGTVSRTIAVNAPITAAFSPDGTRAYITSDTGPPGTLTVFDTQSFTPLQTITVGNGPEDLLVSPDGMSLYVANSYDGSITVINASSYASQTFPISTSLHGLAFIQ